MKKLTVFLIGLVCSVSLFAQTQQISIGSATTTEVFNDVRFDPNDGGTINVGYTTNGGNGRDCYLVKLNASHNIVWQKRIAHAGDDELYKVRVCANGDYIACGYRNLLNPPLGSRDGFVCRINPLNGNIRWATNTSGQVAFGDMFYDLVELANTNIAVVGTQNFTPGSADGMVVLLNANGVQQWISVSDYTANSDEFETINQLPNGGDLVVCGHYWGEAGPQGTSNFYTAKILEINSNTGAINKQFAYQVSRNIAGVNSAINTLWPAHSSLVNNNIVYDMYGVTGAGIGNAIQFVYTYTPVVGTLNGRRFYHNNGSGNFTTYPLTVNDYIITQSNGPAAVYVSRITNGNRVYDNQINNNTTNSIAGIDVINNNLVLAGSTPPTVNDAYMLFSNINFPVNGRPCSIIADNTLTNTIDSPTVLKLAIDFKWNANPPSVMTAPAVLPTIDLTDPINNICGVPCPADTSVNITKCSNQNITLTARAGTTYSWTPSAGLSSTTIQNPVCSAITSTVYTVTIFDAATNCTYHDVFNVTVNNCCPADITTSITKCNNEDITLTARAGTTYSWSPATGLSSTTIQNPVCSAATSTVYTATIFDAVTNCTYHDIFNVTVNNCHCEDSCNWSLTGNSNVKTGYFIGSLNNADFKIRTNNTQRMLVTAAGNVGINTTSPLRRFEVNGDARIASLPSSGINDRVVFANAAGDLLSLAASGNTNQYLSGNGTWQNLSTGGTVNAGQGLTLGLNNTIQLGDQCNMDRGAFTEDRKINMSNQNLYFNSSKIGKLYMGLTENGDRNCRTLYSRLEISTQGLEANNDYSSPTPSTSGLRFTDLTARNEPIPNKFKGVLSLDEDGDVIWVADCCNTGLAASQVSDILSRLSKLENEVKESKNQAAILKEQIAQMDVVLSKTNTIVLNQNVPNPFAESTVITYSIPVTFGKAQLIFKTINGEVIKTADIKTSGKGQINVFANNISSGMYTYTLVIDGNQIETKKMMKQ